MNRIERLKVNHLISTQWITRAFLLVLLILFTADQSLWSGTSRRKVNQGSSSRSVSASRCANFMVQKTSALTRGRQRHRRLKVTRLRPPRYMKPMPELSEAPFSAAVPLLPVIEEAKSRLETESVSYFPKAGRNPARREIKLALANLQTGELQIVSGVEENHKFSFPSSSVKLEVTWWNGFNSSIDVLQPSNVGVVALLYALDPERRRFLGQDAVIYTPYSSALLQPELVEAGKVYLMGKIAQARQELSHIASQAVPGESLESARIFTNEDYFDLILTEQMDPSRFQSIASQNTEFTDEQQGQLMRLAERILVIIGANQEDAYSFTGNYASARGLTQFTPAGMSVVWDRYPTSGIPRDFHKATSHHLNGIKAEICLLDAYLAELSQEYPGLLGSGLEKYAAGASYNGGPRRVHQGLANFGIDWLYPLLRLTALSNKKDLTSKEQLEYQWLRRNRTHETYIYLNKLHAIERVKEKLHMTQTINSPTPEISAAGSAAAQ